MTNPDWFTVATLVLSLPHVPVAVLVDPSDIVTVAVICSVWPTQIVELVEVTVTDVAVTDGVSGAVGLFLQESIKQNKIIRPENKIYFFIFPPLLRIYILIISLSNRDCP
ncbi:hypothetical protein ACFLRM_05265 [Acidobacteriota bacterium]